jgi:hypothetical protein
VVQVLWFSMKEKHDTFKENYTPKILAYKKHQGRKERQIAKTIMAIQELDITTTRVFSYNFYFNLVGCLYKKIIDRIQIYLEE